MQISTNTSTIPILVQIINSNSWVPILNSSIWVQIQNNHHSQMKLLKNQLFRLSNKNIIILSNKLKFKKTNLYRMCINLKVRPHQYKWIKLNLIILCLQTRLIKCLVLNLITLNRKKTQIKCKNRFSYYKLSAKHIKKTRYLPRVSLNFLMN